MTCCQSRRLLPKTGICYCQTHPRAPTGFEVVMVNAIRPWCNLKSVPYPMLPKLLGTEATKSARGILCSASRLSAANSVTLLSSLPLFPATGRPYLHGAWPVLLLFFSTKCWSPQAGRRWREEWVREGTALRKGGASV